MHRRNEFDDLLRSIENINSRNVTEEPEKEKKPSNHELVDELLKELDEVDDDKPKSKSTKKQSQTSEDTSEISNRLIEVSQQTKEFKEYGFNKDLEKDFNIATALDEDKFLQELEEENQKQLETKLALEAILEENLKKKPSAISLDVKAKAPHELVSYQLEQLNKYKKEVSDNLSSANLLRVQALKTFDPKALYSGEQASTMLGFEKGQEIVVLSIFTVDWLAGYLYGKTIDASKTSVKIFPMTICTLLYQSLPRPKRAYEINYWNAFGSLDEVAIGELRKSIIQQPTVFKSMQLSHIFIGTEALPKLIYQGIKDFNTEPSTQYAIDKIPLLSFKKGDIIVVTKLANAAGWCEGYVVNRSDIILGIFPKVFISQVKLKFNN